MSKISVVFALCLLSPDISAQQLLFRNHGRAVANEGILVRKSDFKAPTLMALAKEFVRSHGYSKISKLSIFTDRSDAKQFEYPELFDITYSYAVQKYATISRMPQPPMAEVVCINGSSAMRLFDGMRTVTEVPIAGQSVFHSRLDGIDVSLASVVIVDKRASMFLALPPGSSLEEQKRVAQAIWSRIGSSDVQIFVRNDRWFLNIPPYPFFNRFEEVGDPPPENYFLSNRTVSCIPDEARLLKCVEFHRRPEP